MRVVSAPFNFPKEEEKVIEFWKEIDAFQTSLKLSEGKPEYSFYDGPPFATGLPHYGHLLAGTIKVSGLLHQATSTKLKPHTRTLSQDMPMSAATMSSADLAGIPMDYQLSTKSIRN